MSSLRNACVFTAYREINLPHCEFRVRNYVMDYYEILFCEPNQKCIVEFNFSLYRSTEML